MALRFARRIGGLLSIAGAGATVFVLSDPSSEVRRRLGDNALHRRRKILQQALTQRLSFDGVQEGVNASSNTPHASEQIQDLLMSTNGFLVVTGPDEELSDAAAAHLATALLHSESRSRRARLAVSGRLLSVPGAFSDQVEEQLLRISRSEGAAVKHMPTATSLTSSDHHDDALQQGRSWQDGSLQEAESTQAYDDQHSSSPLAEMLKPLTKWEELVLQATRWFMQRSQLDHAALWALRQAVRDASNRRRQPSPTDTENSQTLSEERRQAKQPDRAYSGLTTADEAEALRSSSTLQSVRANGREVTSHHAEMTDDRAIHDGFCLLLEMHVDPQIPEEPVDEAGQLYAPLRQPEVVQWAWELAQHRMGRVIVRYDDGC